MLKFGASDEVSTIKSSMAQAKHYHKICFVQSKSKKKVEKMKFLMSMPAGVLNIFHVMQAT